jgi:hypothetical protein
MEKNDDKRQQLLVELMASGGVPPPQDGKAHLLQPWWLLSRQLSPLIGESGFCALFGRTVRLTGPGFRWLPVGPSPKSIDALIATLSDGFGAGDPDAAGVANAALLDTFLKLLADVIGEALTIRLVRSAVECQGAPKNVQEQK